MARQRANVTVGQQVVGSDLAPVGVVEEVRADDFLVSRGRVAGIYVPFDAIKGIERDRIMLNDVAADVDLENWPRPATAGTVGGVSVNPGPAGTGMPFGQPGGLPTFEGTGRDNPGPGSDNLVSDSSADIPNTPTRSVISGTPPIDWPDEQPGDLGRRGRPPETDLEGDEIDTEP